MSALSALAASPNAALAAIGGAGNNHAKARAAAQEFEAVFLNAMLQPVANAASNNGPFSGGPAAGVWRSMLTDEYAKSFAANGGIGIADQVYRSLIGAQESHQDHKQPSSTVATAHR
jgi:Rod binding domain-containing protein